jgi:NAD(P)-dependent dehydrogenase (short-subunit alcohol dehydrogenase family)
MSARALPQPPPPEKVTVQDIHRCTRVLEALVADRAVLATIPEEDQIALRMAAGRLLNPERDAQKRLIKALRKQGIKAQQAHDRQVRASARIRALRQQPVFTAPVLPSGAPANATPGDPGRTLVKSRNCYVCKVEYRHLHHFYDSMCQGCGDFNYARRFQTAPLHGKVALITGARVKIGFQASLMLLRSGARVIATTRFPHDAVQRYAAEPDFADWSHRLHVHGLDLRHAPAVELFARHLQRTHDRLDILINNAAQTVRRPPGFYAHLMALESRPLSQLPASSQALLADHVACVQTLTGDPQLAAGRSGSELLPTWRSTDPALGIHGSAALSMVPYSLAHEEDVEKLFPAGKLDADLQQVDLRAVNSWRLTLGEVETAEMLEVHLVNAVAPFILCAKLKPLMLKDRSEPGHIVNVSAMEGSFSRKTKTDKHPHTNMAKAALNMMTLTSAPDYARSNIYMNAADTGWVTDEDPAIHAQRKVEELDFQPPLDIVDGAARVVDPVFTALRTGRFVHGLFFKDYHPTDW